MADARTVIIAAAAAVWGLEPDQLLTQRRDRQASAARKTAATLLLEHGYSSVSAGVALQRDHSTVLHAVKSARNLGGDFSQKLAEARDAARRAVESAAATASIVSGGRSTPSDAFTLVDGLPGRVIEAARAVVAAYEGSLTVPPVIPRNLLDALAVAVHRFDVTGAGLECDDD